MTPNCTRNNIISSKNAHSDNSAVSLNIAFDEESPLRGPGFWKFNYQSFRYHSIPTMLKY